MRNWPATVVAVIAVILLLNYGAPFFIPLFVALMISYALAPLVDQATRVLRFRWLSAGVIVVGLVGLVCVGAWAWADDAQAILEKVPDAAKSISRTVQRIARKPADQFTEVKKAAAEIENVAQAGRPAQPGAAPPLPAPSADSPAQVSIWQVMWVGWKGFTVAITQLTVVLFLVFFMLASGDFFKRKLVAISGERLAERKFTMKVIDEIDSQIRRYLVVMLVANTLVGLGTWAVFALFGLRYAGLWGVIAAILHTIPYFGPALIAAGSLIVGLVQFGDWRALAVAGSSVVVATLVGQLFATWFASRQLRMNATASFVGLLFFAWIWGLWGLLLGIPILAIVKAICDHNDDWKPVGELLGR
jgi:predicted PurR-regulated permease PerM